MGAVGFDMGDEMAKVDRQVVTTRGAMESHGGQKQVRRRKHTSRALQHIL